MAFQKGHKLWMNRKSKSEALDHPGSPVVEAERPLIEQRDGKIILNFPIEISESAYLYLRTVAEGRQQSFEDIISQAIDYCVNNGLF